ncbi:hypothetical protein ACIQYF_01425 [Pseudomonas sp. NPDC096917]|uniref:hypothetical protein n=1 Tax=Pseudomonas sp. NPDC096917 TaxID=3364483 RepID=UPI00383AE69E
MTQHLDQEPAQETLPFSYAEFICRPCGEPVSLSIEDSILLANDKSVRCPLCNVAVNAGAYDQQCLSKVHDSLSSSGKFLIPFAIVWFSVSFIVALFFNTQISVVMTSVGVLISFALNQNTPVIEEPIYLEREIERVVSQSAVQ